ncbi:ABC transporter permease [Mucilaginibacter polytrichastri]|uniref:Uncharacterized protein n=1 Tax=Mucilaginibacter polytrichastri TaxID=1302689 RepID=A0A1Q5ZST2_9SPHI|nr:hypothetical protein [Mucilaginibacter polytrichastri]OKS84831.1 hypothetical protein RG47T_0266 [Mucilaginibacter polytrichastri]SFS48897.1 hypothetical protein SAMN04487890_101808 [Mucilaginibacter polytrichastri]
MKYIYSIIKADYLQRTRSYAFLVTLAITVYVAYLFVPLPTANYTTLSMPGYKGAFNSAWVGYVSAMMTTIMLSLYGFFLINTGIKKDIDTEVGLIVATTPITNLGYLLSKMLSNFLVLLTILGITFVVSIAMFFVRGSGYPFIIGDFVVPYILFALPSLFFVSAMAIAAEVFLRDKLILQCIAFIFFFGVVIGGTKGLPDSNTTVLMDVFGVKTLTGSIKNQVNTQYHAHIDDISMGFIFSGHKKPYQTFVWNGVAFSNIFLLSRLLWLVCGLAVVYLSSFFFHRFDFKQAVRSKKIKNKETDGQLKEAVVYKEPATISLKALPKLVPDYGIVPFIKTELLLLIRKGSKWLWLVIAGIWVGMIFAPLDIAYGIMLPVIWFLQVTRWSELATKEKTNQLHYFTYSSYKPLQRMLPAQILAGVIVAVVLALPIIVRCGIAQNNYAVFNIINGAIFIVLLAICLGIVSGGKKLYEILFFMITYALVEKLFIADYLGAVPHNSHIMYIAIILGLNTFLAITSFTVRNHQARHL